MKGTLKIIGRGTRESSFNIIEDFTPGAGITFLSDVSINTHLIVPDASFNRIAPIDGSLVIIGDLSVNGNIHASGLLTNNHSFAELKAQIIQLTTDISLIRDHLGI